MKAAAQGLYTHIVFLDRNVLPCLPVPRLPDGQKYWAKRTESDQSSGYLGAKRTESRESSAYLGAKRTESRQSTGYQKLKGLVPGGLVTFEEVLKE